MNNQLTYSILQYRHSSLLEEAINVGILFYFPGEHHCLYFYHADASRIKAIYEDFDQKYFAAILKVIERRIEISMHNLLIADTIKNDFKCFIDNEILRFDDTVLQFSSIKSAINIYASVEKTINEYSKLLLPLTNKKDSQITKIDDQFIIRQFKTKLIGDRKDIASKVQKDIRIETNQWQFKFEIAWQNGSLNLVQPLSFDLQDVFSIQRKTAEHCSYLRWLNDYTSKNNCRVDLLLAPPRDSSLMKNYDRSIKLLEDVDSNKKIVRQEEIEEYTSQALQYLLSEV